MIQRLGWTLLHFLWQGSVVAIAYGLLRRIVKGPQARYVLGCVAMAAMIAAPMLTVLLMPGAGSNTAVWTIPASEGQRIFPVVVAAWAAGVLGFSIRLLGGWRFTARLRATSHPAPVEWQQTLERIAVQMGARALHVRLVVSSLISVPTVIGWLRPLILVPVESLTGLPAEQLRALLAHELAHIRRHDYLVSVLQSIAEAVLFYHPAVWWISEQIRVERELCCDDMAVAASGDVLMYARALAALETARASILPAANGGSLAERIQRLVEPARESADSLPGPGAAWAMTLLWLAGVGVATAHGAQTTAVSAAVAFEPLPMSMSAPVRPDVTLPAATLASRVKKTLAYDPLLVAQVEQPRAAPEVALPWSKWLNEDVTYIITDLERQAFEQLKTDEEREMFVEQFWLRRDPTPDTVENEFREEHYRRIAFANGHFATANVGWKTDRGRIYIVFGPPDEVDSHPAGSSIAGPYEDWRYRHMDGIGNNVLIEFVDKDRNGDYRMSLDPSEIPPRTNLPEPFAQQQPAPKLKFNELDDAIGKLQTYEILPMLVRVDYMRVTGTSVMANITVQFENHDLQFEAQGGVQKSTVNILGRVSSMTRQPVATFEKPLTIEAPAARLQQVAQQRSMFQQSVPLAPGRYRLNIMAKDIVGGRLNNYEVTLEVPQFDAEKLTPGSLVLADVIERLPASGTGGAMFTIGDTKVRPRLGNRFTRGEKLGIYLQIYNFGPDEQTQKPAGSIEYEIDKAGSNQRVMEFSEPVGNIANASATQVTIEKMLPLKTFEPGSYTLRISVIDRNRRQTARQEGNFTVSAE